MNGFGFNSWPDRVYYKKPKFGGQGGALWIEYKRPGEEPSDAQEKIHNTLRACGEKVIWTDDPQVAVEAFKRL